MPYRTIGKKEEERLYLDRFKDSIDDFPNGEIEEFEEPDFLIRENNKIVGIEVTKMFWERNPDELPQQAKESVHDLIAIKASKLHTENGLPTCHVSVHFSQTKLKKKDTDTVARIIFDIVSKNIPRPGSSIQIPPNAWTCVPLPGELSAVSIHQIDEIGETFYSAPQFGWIPNLRADSDLQSTINVKNGRINAYRKNCDEIWLLINLGFGSISSQFDVPDDVLRHNYVTHFDRIYLLHQMNNRCWRLQIGA